jgi:hypothetical protein
MQSRSTAGGAIENVVGAICRLLPASWSFASGPNSFFGAMAVELVRAEKQRSVDWS